MRRAWLILWLGCLACSTPTTVVRSQSDRPGLVLVGAPVGATVLVDGLTMGRADKFNGKPGYLELLPGTHILVVQDRQGGVLLERKVFLESGLKTVQVN